MHVTFSKPKSGRGVVADAVLHFTEGPLADYKLEGLSIIDGTHGLFASMPSRPYTDHTGAKKFWDLIRFEGQGDGKYAFRNWVVAEYKRQHGPDSQADGHAEEVPF